MRDVAVVDGRCCVTAMVGGVQNIELTRHPATDMYVQPQKYQQ